MALGCSFLMKEHHSSIWKTGHRSHTRSSERSRCHSPFPPWSQAWAATLPILPTLDHEPRSQILEYLYLVPHLLFVPAHEGRSMNSYIRKIFDCWDPGLHTLFRMAVECSQYYSTRTRECPRASGPLVGEQFNRNHEREVREYHTRVAKQQPSLAPYTIGLHKIMICTLKHLDRARTSCHGAVLTAITSLSLVPIGLGSSSPMNEQSADRIPGRRCWISSSSISTSCSWNWLR
jgi:hypothetical protein